jgi:hypothetical protein
LVAEYLNAPQLQLDPREVGYVQFVHQMTFPVRAAKWNRTRRHYDIDGRI